MFGNQFNMFSAEDQFSVYFGWVTREDDSRDKTYSIRNWKLRAAIGIDWSEKADIQFIGQKKCSPQSQSITNGNKTVAFVRTISPTGNLRARGLGEWIIKSWVVRLPSPSPCRYPRYWPRRSKPTLLLLPRCSVNKHGTSNRHHLPAFSLHATNKTLQNVTAYPALATPPPLPWLFSYFPIVRYFNICNHHSQQQNNRNLRLIRLRVHKFR